MSGNKTETTAATILLNTDYEEYPEWRRRLNTEIGRKANLNGQLKAAGIVCVEQNLEDCIEQTKEAKRKQTGQREIQEKIDNGTVQEGTQEYDQLRVEWGRLGKPEHITNRIKELKDEFDKLSKEFDALTNNTKEIFVMIEKTVDDVLQKIAMKEERDHEKDKAMGLKKALEEIDRRMKGNSTEIQAKLKEKLTKTPQFRNCTELQNLLNQMDMIKIDMENQAKESKITADIKDAELIKVLRDRFKPMSKEDRSALPVTVRATLEKLDPATDKWAVKIEEIRKELINPITDEKEAEKLRREEKKDAQETKQEAVAFTTMTSGNKDRVRRPPGSDPRPCHYKMEDNCPFGRDCEYQHENDNRARGDNQSTQERGRPRIESRDSRRDRSRSRDYRGPRDRGDRDRSMSRERRDDRGDRDRDRGRDRDRDRDRGDRSRSSSRDTVKNAPQDRGGRYSGKNKNGDKGSSTSRRT